MSIALTLIALAAAAPAPAPEATTAVVAQPGRRGAIALAPKLGLWKSTADLGPAIYVAGEAGYLVPLGGHGLQLGLEVGYASAGTEGVVSDPQLVVGSHTASGAYKVRERQIGLLGVAAYRRTVTPALVAYGGVGLGVYFHGATARAFETKNEETEGSFGFRVGGGIEWHLGPGGIFGEIQYHHTSIGFLSTGSVSVGGFLVPGVGYRLALDL
jgi:hypothetical protein